MTESLEHDRWAARLSDYVDGHLDSADVEALEAHVAHCEVCESALRDLRGVIHALHAARGPSPAAAITALWPGVERRLDLGRHAISVAPDDAGRWPRRLLAAGLLLSAGAAGGWWVGAARCGRAPGWPAGIGAMLRSANSQLPAFAQLALLEPASRNDERPVGCGRPGEVRAEVPSSCPRVVGDSVR